jgi:transcriptional regulator, badM/rrf2 family
VSYSNAFFQAIEIVIFISLASQKDNRKYISVKLISESLGFSYSTTVKIIDKLKSENLIITKEGINGGISVVRSLSEITMLDIFEAIEKNNPLFKIQYNTSLLGNPIKRIENNIRNRLTDSEKMLRVFLSQVFVQDLVGEESQKIICNENVTLANNLNR